jgi:hypothetical protein
MMAFERGEQGTETLRRRTDWMDRLAAAFQAVGVVWTLLATMLFSALVFFGIVYGVWQLLSANGILSVAPHTGWWNWLLGCWSIAAVAGRYLEVRRPALAGIKAASAVPKFLAGRAASALVLFGVVYGGWDVLSAHGITGVQPHTGWWDWLLGGWSIAEGLSSFAEQRGPASAYGWQALCGALFGGAVLALFQAAGMVQLSSLQSSDLPGAAVFLVVAILGNVAILALQRHGPWAPDDVHE